jgi:hypothetical protein
MCEGIGGDFLRTELKIVKQLMEEFRSKRGELVIKPCSEEETFTWLRIKNYIIFLCTSSSFGEWLQHSIGDEVIEEVLCHA